MKKILRRRAFRDLRKNKFRYLALGLMVMLSIYLVVSLLGAALTVISGVSAFQETNQVEDGEFFTFTRLTEKELQQIREKGVEVEEEFYLDQYGSDGSQIRLFRNRENINLFYCDTGSIPRTNDEIAVEKRYAEVHELDIGDTLTVGEKRYTICGIGSSPDYDSPTADVTNSMIDSMNFGTAIVTKEEFAKLEQTGDSIKAESFVYAYRLNNYMTDEELRKMIESFPFDPDTVDDPYFQEYLDQVRGDIKPMLNMLNSPLFSSESDSNTTQKLKELVDPNIHNLQQFIKRENNMRIGTSAERMTTNLYGSGICGVIILILLAYVMSIFTLHEIDKNSTVIGTLYALGIKAKELKMHYAVTPAVITGIAGVIGTIVGYSPLGVLYQMQDTYGYYSVPEIAPHLFVGILIYGVILPPFMTLGVNLAVISKRLKRPALALIRNEKKRKNTVDLPLERFGFLQRFRIRELIREGRAVLTVLVGLYICLFLFLFGVDTYVFCQHIAVNNVADTKYEYMYFYKYPDAQVPQHGEEAYAVTVKKDSFGYNMDVTILGIEKDNPYFDVPVKQSEKQVTISSAMAQKFGLKKGDTVTLDDEENGKYYTFEVTDITQYSPGFFVFMDLNSLRDMMGQPSDYYNTVFSDQKLNIDSGKLYSTLTRQSIVETAGTFMEQDASMIYTVLGAAAAILILVVYLMLSIMIDHASYDISLMKIFGYRVPEIRKMYLSGNFVLISLGMIVILPLAKLSIDAVYPMLISNVASSMDLSVPWYAMLSIYVMVVVLTYVTMRLLSGKIKKVSLAEVLKNRD